MHDLKLKVVWLDILIYMQAEASADPEEGDEGGRTEEDRANVELETLTEGSIERWVRNSPDRRIPSHFKLIFEPCTLRALEK